MIRRCWRGGGPPLRSTASQGQRCEPHSTLAAWTQRERLRALQSEDQSGRSQLSKEGEARLGNGACLGQLGLP